MTYDRILEPIVAGGKLIVGFNDQDKVIALDTDTGRDEWTSFAEAPVRLPPAAYQGSVFFVADDGFLYCVDLRSGETRWKFFGAPGARHAIGNRRLASAWPARGGPVVRDDTVYFAASIWPFMGTFIYALDARSGEVQWVNDRTGAQYIKQPHSAPSFAGVAPQGALIATADALVVPGGRSVPAVFDRQNGELRYFEINAGGKGTGGSFVAADSKHFYVHTREKGTRAFRLSDGVKTAFLPNEPVLKGGIAYSAEENEDGDPVVRAYGPDHEQQWEIKADGRGDLVLAGQQLVAAGPKGISIIDLPSKGQAVRVTKMLDVVGGAERLLVADGKLFAVTIDGRILAFGGGKQASPPGPTEAIADVETPKTDPLVATRVDQLLEAGRPEGYALWFGPSTSPLVRDLAQRSPFQQLAIVDPDAERVDASRRWLNESGRYGQVTVHHAEPGEFKAPNYIANMVVVDQTSLGGLSHQQDLRRRTLADLYESVRPYGGLLCLIGSSDPQGLANQIESAKLEQARVTVEGDLVIVSKEGALPGAADWTHQYGDVANTVKSDDRRVRLPLGLLWFGGSSNTDVLPRHGHGPPEQVIGGRLFIQGINTLSARDVYTGRVLWRREFEDLGTYDVYFDKTYEDVPLDPKYNQVHIPGANGRGTNYVVTEDRVYLVEGANCHILDPATGETIKRISLPGAGEAGRRDADNAGDQPEWGYIGVYKDVLIGGMGFANYRSRHRLSFEEDKKLKDTKAGFGAKSFDRAASKSLVGFDRHTGEMLWKVDANHSFWHNGIVAGGEQVYCLDRNPSRIEQALLRRGIPKPDTYRILALDYRTGEPKWEIDDRIFGTWLGYSEEFDLLLQAGASASDRLTDESSRGMAVYSGVDGSVKWQKPNLKYTGPCILHNDWIITNANSYAESAGAFFLLDGRQKMVTNPVTGEQQPWRLTRAYGCNNIIASENLLTFRSGSAGYYDLLSDGGTGNLGGFKSGCTSNLVVANGVLNAPDYTRTCSCAYQNQTSLALVHMPDIDLWSVDSSASEQSHGKRIESLGINFGAPGDRRDASGRLWFEYPVVSGESPPIALRLNGEASPYSQHSQSHSGQSRSWVLASGVDGVTDIRLQMKLRDQYELHTGIPVSHENDDAQEDETGEILIDNGKLELSEETGSRVVGLRFTDIQLARDSVIRRAYLQFTCDKPSSEVAELQIAGEDTANASRFSKDKHDLSTRSRTHETVMWEPEEWKKSGDSKEAQRTPDLSPILREIISQPDWQPGNSIAFLIEGAGKRNAAAFRSGNQKVAMLVVDADPSAVDALREPTPAEPYQLRLLFGLPPQQQARVFDVVVQGRTIREGLTLSPGADGSAGSLEIVEEVMVGDELHVELVPRTGAPLLSGLEVVGQEAVNARKATMFRGRWSDENETR